MSTEEQAATEKSSPSSPPPAAKKRKVRGAVHVSANRCKGCGFCIAFCPPKVLAFSEEFNLHGYHPPHLTDPDGCTGCDLCGLYCPDFAIYGVMLKYPAVPPPPSGESAEVRP